MGKILTYVSDFLIKNNNLIVLTYVFKTYFMKFSKVEISSFPSAGIFIHCFSKDKY